jgi:hypothetical protein
MVKLATARTSWKAAQTGLRTFVVPDATQIEKRGAYAMASLGSLLSTRVSGVHLSKSESSALRSMAFHLWGGAWANNTPTSVRWYSRDGQTQADHLRFAAVHLHPFAIAFIDRARNGDDSDEDVDGGVDAGDASTGRRRLPRWAWALMHYGFLIGATVALTQDDRRRRGVGLALTGVGIVMDQVAGPSRVAPWFAPVYYAKLLAGHAAGSFVKD